MCCKLTHSTEREAGNKMKVNKSLLRKLPVFNGSLTVWLFFY